MNILDKIRLTVDELDIKSFVRYAVIGGIILFLLMVGLLWWRSASLSALEEQFDGLQEQREEVNELLARYKIIKKEQADFDALIAKDKNFNILQYFDNLLKSAQVKFTGPKLAEGAGTDADLEFTASTIISRTDMKTLVTILKKIEDNQRVTIKSIEITQASGSKVDVMLEIATLEKRIK